VSRSCSERAGSRADRPLTPASVRRSQWPCARAPRVHAARLRQPKQPRPLSPGANRPETWVSFDGRPSMCPGATRSYPSSVGDELVPAQTAAAWTRCDRPHRQQCRGSAASRTRHDLAAARAAWLSDEWWASAVTGHSLLPTAARFRRRRAGARDMITGRGNSTSTAPADLPFSVPRIDCGVPFHRGSRSLPTTSDDPRARRRGSYQPGLSTTIWPQACSSNYYVRGWPTPPTPRNSRPAGKPPCTNRERVSRGADGRHPVDRAGRPTSTRCAHRNCLRAAPAPPPPPPRTPGQSRPLRCARCGPGESRSPCNFQWVA